MWRGFSVFLFLPPPAGLSIITNNKSEPWFLLSESPGVVWCLWIMKVFIMNDSVILFLIALSVSLTPMLKLRREFKDNSNVFSDSRFWKQVWVSPLSSDSLTSTDARQVKGCSAQTSDQVLSLSEQLNVNVRPSLQSLTNWVTLCSVCDLCGVIWAGCSLVAVVWMLQEVCCVSGWMQLKWTPQGAADDLLSPYFIQRRNIIRGFWGCWWFAVQQSFSLTSVSGDKTFLFLQFFTF